jgi:hypothetical protein
LHSIADENDSQGETRRRHIPAFVLGRSDCKSAARTIFIEPVLIVASSLLWIIVLPFAAVVCSGIAISNLVEAN